MADGTIVNGGINDEAGEDFYDPDQGESIRGGKVMELNRKIEQLESEKVELVRQNQESEERMEKLTGEMEKLRSDEEVMKRGLEEMRSEIEQSDEEKKLFDTFVARNLELETEVSRLQHELITSMTDSDEANAEIVELKNLLAEKGAQAEELEKELENLKKEKAESEKKERELERKIGVLEVKGTEERSKKLRVEEEMRERIDEKETEISALKKKVDDLVSELAKRGVELENWKSEKKRTEEALNESEERVRTMELKIIQIQMEAREAEKVIGGLKERSVEAINGIPADNIDGGRKGSELQWPLVAAGSTGAIALASALLYVYYRRRS